MDKKGKLTITYQPLRSDEEHEAAKNCGMSNILTISHDPAKAPDDMFTANFNTLALREILERPDVKDMPFLVVCVGGARRMGKSLLVNLFIKYLEYHQSQVQSERSDGGWRETNPLIGGVDWRQSVEPVTRGIQMWNHPFVIKTMNGSSKQVAVILLDCEGLDGTKDIQKTIDAATTMHALELSSVFIMNLDRSLNLPDLEHIKRAATQVVTTDMCEDEKAFKTLMLLFKNWQGGEIYGVCESPLQLSRSTEMEKLIRKSFENYLEFAMPAPGRNIQRASVEDKLSLEDFNKNEESREFIETFEELCDHLFVSSASNPKCLKTYEEMCKSIERLEAHKIKICKESPAGEVERLKILETWHWLEREIYPEMATRMRNVQDEQSLESMAEQLKEETMEHVNRRKEAYPGFTDMGKESWRSVEDSIDLHFKNLLHNQLKRVRSEMFGNASERPDSSHAIPTTTFGSNRWIDAIRTAIINPIRIACSYLRNISARCFRYCRARCSAKDVNTPR